MTTAPEMTWEELEAIAAEKGIPVYQVVDELVEQELEKVKV